MKFYITNKQSEEKMFKAKKSPDFFFIRALLPPFENDEVEIKEPIDPDNLDKLNSNKEIQMLEYYKFQSYEHSYLIKNICIEYL